jgi:hypothetical protein
MIKSKICKIGDFVRILYPNYRGLYGCLYTREDSERWLVKLTESHSSKPSEMILLSLEESEFEQIEPAIEQ